MHRNFYTYIFVISLVLLAVFLAVKPLNSKPAVSPLQLQPLSISGAVVPHHDLVKAQRAEFFKKLADQVAPKTVILVSPNHYDAGRAGIQTTDKVWELSNGTLEPNRGALVGSVETASFQNEHGIYTVLPDIKRVWPDAKIVPIILKFNTSTSSVQALHDALLKTCSDCLLVASVDFSHYQPAILANLHDELSIRALQNLDEDLIRAKAEVDSPPSLQLLIKWAKSHDTLRFNLNAHTNSGDLLQDQDIETTTHVFGYYDDEQRKMNNEKRVTFLIGGDMMFARGVHYKFAKDLKESVANLGDRLFWGTDASIVNLEGAISALPVVPDPGPHFKFVFPPETVAVLKFLHINAVSIDNNHASNGSPKITQELLEKKDIQILPITIQGEGLKLTAIGINALWQIPNIKSQITNIKSDPNQRVIVFPHWGEEYKPIHNKQQEQLAHEWIDAGADLVIGSHPHVIQDAEIYKGKPIFYSLGNLLFDQNWSQATQEGMLIGGAFTEDGLEGFGLPVISKNLQPELARGATKQRLLKKIEGGMISP